MYEKSAIQQYIKIFAHSFKVAKLKKSRPNKKY
jgi:hypothetical protein